MSWVRLDDGFTNHAKIVDLSDAEFRAWIRLLCYCARVEDPTVDTATRREVAGLNSRRIKHFTDLGLLDSYGDVYEIHDWSTYRKKDETNADRQARWRARQKSVSNGVTRAVTEAVTEGVTSLARDQARTPVPEPEPEPELQRQASKNESQRLSESRPEERLPIEKMRLAVELKAVAPVSIDGAATIDFLCSSLPEGSLAKVLESVAAKRGTVGPGYVINALRSEQRELAERSVA